MGDDSRSGSLHVSIDSVGDPLSGEHVPADLGYHWSKRFLNSTGTPAKHAVVAYRGRWYSACSIACAGRHPCWRRTTRELKGWLKNATCHQCTLAALELARQMVLGQQIVDELGLPAPGQLEAVS